MDSFTLPALWKALCAAAPAFFGAVGSLRFLPSETTYPQSVLAVATAYGLGSFWGRGLVAYWGITNEHVADAVVLTVALFGMAAAAAIYQEMRPIVRALVARVFGRQK